MSEEPCCIPDELIEASEELFQLATSVEMLESHIAAIEDGLDDEKWFRRFE